MENAEIWRLAAAVIAGMLIYAGLPAVISQIRPPAAPIAGFSLDQTIADIKRELVRVENDTGPRLGLDLESVKIELQLKQADERSAGLGLAVPVFTEAALKAGTIASSEESSKLTVVLVPPTGRVTLSTDAAPRINFADLLIAARTSLVAAMDSEPALDAKSIELQIGFVLVQTTSGSASVKAAVISAEAGTKLSATAGNTVTLSYANPAYAKEAKPAAP